MQQQYKWIDVTSELIDIRAELKMMELIKQDTISLQDCMQAQQINDDKMDTKFDISYQHTIKAKLENKQILLPHQLNIKQIATVFANVLQLEACTLQGQPLSSTIYTFSYLFDRKIWENHYLFNALVQSIYCIGSYVMDLIKQAASIKQDDFHMSPYSYSKNLKTQDEVSQLILQAQKKFEAENKKNQDKISYNFVMNVLRMRRSMHSLAKNLGVNYDPKNQKKIDTDLQATKKKIIAVQEVKFVIENKLLPKVFLPDLQKTLKCHSGPRVLKLRTLQQSFKEFKSIIQHIQLVLPVPTKITQLKNRVQILESLPYNAWSKSYIKSNLFAKQNYFFSVVKSEQALIADINDWVHLTQNVKQNEKFTNLIKLSSPVINETIYRMLSNPMRWYWQCSKNYQDYNIVIHMSNQVDANVAAPGTKQFYTSSWFYYYGLECMTKQLLVGFQIKLFEQSELKYVFFVLENLLSICSKNGDLHLRRMDKSIVQNFHEGNFTKKMKKKLNENEKALFINIIFKKGLHLYFRSLFRIICILHADNFVQNKFAETEEIRVKNRFRIFKNIMFTRVIDYEEYKSSVQGTLKSRAQVLPECLQELKQVKNLFKLLTSQLDQNEILFKQKQDAQALMTLSVKASLIVMTLKMNMGGNKKFGIDLNGRYPQITMS